jgi:hypothetical protein
MKKLFVHAPLRFPCLGDTKLNRSIEPIFAIDENQDKLPPLLLPAPSLPVAGHTSNTHLPFCGYGRIIAL